MFIQPFFAALTAGVARPPVRSWKSDHIHVQHHSYSMIDKHGFKRMREKRYGPFAFVPQSKTTNEMEMLFIRNSAEKWSHSF